MSRRLAVLTLLVLGGVALVAVRPDAAQRPKPPGAEFKGEAFRLNKIQDGIYHAVGTGALSVGCNAAIIVNADDVLVVDSHSSPAAAWALAEQIKTITDKPIRYVINTHFHWDHAHGNQIYGPGVEIIGHEFTRRMLAAGASTSGRSYDMFIGGIPGQIAQLSKQIDATPDGPARDALQERLFIQQQYRAATDAVKVQPPTVTLTDALTLYRGGREIRLLFLGRGHTGGDVVVFLPRERIVASGDLLTAGPSYWATPSSRNGPRRSTSCARSTSTGCCRGTARPSRARPGSITSRRISPTSGSRRSSCTTRVSARRTRLAGSISGGTSPTTRASRRSRTSGS